MYLIYRKHKLCHSLVVWFGFWCSLRCDCERCLVTFHEDFCLLAVQSSKKSFPPKPEILILGWDISRAQVGEPGLRQVDLFYIKADVLGR